MEMTRRKAVRLAAAIAVVVALAAGVRVARKVTVGSRALAAAGLAQIPEQVTNRSISVETASLVDAVFVDFDANPVVVERWRHMSPWLQRAQPDPRFAPTTYRLTGKSPSATVTIDDGLKGVHIAVFYDDPSMIRDLFGP